METIERGDRKSQTAAPPWSSYRATTRFTVLVSRFSDAVIGTGVLEDTAEVCTTNVALVEPAGTVTVDGALAGAPAGTDRRTVVPPAGATPVSTTIPVLTPPPFTVLGLNVNVDNRGAVTARVARALPPPSCARTTVAVSNETGLVETVAVADV